MLAAAITGTDIPALKRFDAVVTEFMRRRGVPGGALAVVKEGRLIHARGYGWADKDAKRPVAPTALFRIASISKPFTAVAVMTLVQNPRYRLSLDTRAFPLLGLKPHLEGGAKPDPRLDAITIRHLLQHTGGWDREKSGDPMFQPGEIAEKVGAPAPAGPEAIIRYMLGRPLDSDPGARYAYSNFGYCVLGRIIEKVTGQTYGECVRRAVLAPMSITRMRLGRSRLNDRAPGEVCYYQPNAGTIRSVFPADEGNEVPWPYGGFHLEAMDAHGGWLASAVDLARFAAALDAPRGRPLLTPRSVEALYARPTPPIGRESDGAPSAFYYGLGWLVRPVGNEGAANVWHNGSLPGTYTLLVRRWDGLSWAVLFNQRSENDAPPDGEIDGALHRAADAVRDWPAHDLFPKYR